MFLHEGSYQDSIFLVLENIILDHIKKEPSTPQSIVENLSSGVGLNPSLLRVAIERLVAKNKVRLCSVE